MKSILHKITIYLSLSHTTKLMMHEAYFFLGWARILKLLPFKKISPSLGNPMEESSYEMEAENKELLKRISSSIDTMSRYTFWESQCLVKAIAGMKMLERRNLESTLYLGTSKDDSGNLIAHAWLRCGGYYISGAEGKESFTVVGKFAKRITSEKTTGKWVKRGR